MTSPSQWSGFSAGTPGSASVPAASSETKNHLDWQTLAYKAAQIAITLLSLWLASRGAKSPDR